MQADDKREYLFDKPRNVNRLFRVFYGACVVLLLLDLVLHRHAERAWEGMAGFYALFGFVAFVALVLVAKVMRKLLMRAEDYYNVDE